MRIIRSILIFAILVFLAIPVALADKHEECVLEPVKGESIPTTFNVTKCLKTKDQKTTTDITGVLLKAIDLFVQIIASISLVIFIIGALLTVTSEGKEDRLEKGKTAMLYAIIGLLIALFSFLIVTFVQSILF